MSKFCSSITTLPISPASEFTPTPIQTRDERADLVYAFKIRVPNQNGVLKIGMPVDVQFDAVALQPVAGVVYLQPGLLAQVVFAI